MKRIRGRWLVGKEDREENPYHDMTKVPKFLKPSLWLQLRSRNKQPAKYHVESCNVKMCKAIPTKHMIVGKSKKE